MNELQTSLKESRWSDVIVRGDPEKIDRAVEMLDSVVQNGWIRDTVREHKLADADLWREGNRLYSYRDDRWQEVASVTVCRDSPSVLHGGQAVPLGKANVEYRLFQQSVIEFMEKVFLPTMTQSGLSVDYRTGFGLLESDLAPSARRSLEEFIEVARRITNVSRMKIGVAGRHSSLRHTAADRLIIAMFL